MPLASRAVQSRRFARRPRNYSGGGTAVDTRQPPLPARHRRSDRQRFAVSLLQHLAGHIFTDMQFQAHTTTRQNHRRDLHA